MKYFTKKDLLLKSRERDAVRLFWNTGKNVFIAVLAILFAFLLTGIIMLCLGYEPVEAYKQLVKGCIGNRISFSESLVKMIPLTFTGLSFAIALRGGMINLGAAGQLYIGSLCGSLVGIYIHGLPLAFHIFLALAAGFVGGGIYGIIVALLKNKFNANELITTIMLNEIAIEFLNYLIANPLKDLKAASQFPQSRAVMETAVLPRLLPGTRLHAGIFIALLALIFYWFFLRKTKQGYEVRITGLNPSAAECAGMNIKKIQLRVMFLAGGFAGIGGCIEILSVQKRLMQEFAGNLGFDGIAVALLGGNNPVGILFSSLLFGMMNNGSNKMQMLAKVPSPMIYVMQGLIILFVVGYRLYTKGYWTSVIRKVSEYRLKKKGNRI